MPEVKTFRFDYKVPENLADFDPDDFIRKSEMWIDEQIGIGPKVAISASGGVDSTVAAYLLHDVIGDDLYPFFLDDGCRRLINGKPEGEVTRRIFNPVRNFGLLDVESDIKPKLIGLSDGEEKRKAFIAAYKAVSDRHIKEIGADWIADGTIAPDIKETVGRYKTQHNVGWDYAVNKLEPLASLSKPQVRKVGMALGLPEEFVHRIPCPGPAQIIRVVGKFTPEKLKIAQDATDIVEQAVDRYYLKMTGKPYSYDEKTGKRTPFQYFGVVMEPDMELNGGLTDLAGKILNPNSKGFVMEAQTTVVPEGGKRPEKPIYKPVALLETTAGVGYDELERLSKEAWEKLQLPRILLWVSFNHKSASPYTVGIRVVESVAAAEAKPARIDIDYLRDVGENISAKTGVPRVAYDISFKPPATIEFE